jgi:hypothetical protein
LFVVNLQRLEKLIDAKDGAVAAIRVHRKQMKVEGFMRPEVDYALWIRKEGEEVAKERLAQQLKVAEWLGKPLGFQAALDLAAQ